MQDLVNIGVFAGIIFGTSWILAKILKKEASVQWAGKITKYAIIILFALALVWWLSV